MNYVLRHNIRVFCHKRRRRQRPVEQARCVISRTDLNSEGLGANNSTSASFL